MNITKRFLLISLFIFGIIYTGCEEKSAVDKAMSGNISAKVSGKVDSNGIHVWINAKDNGDGASWEKAYNDLQKAIEAAKKAGKNKVYIAQGTYKPAGHPNGGQDDREKHFSLRNGIEVIGGYSGKGNKNDPKTYKTILSGDIGVEGDDSDNIYHVFYHPKGTNLDKTAKLENVIITKGNANGKEYYGTGGGMFNYESSPELNNCTFTNNTAKGGGGMANADSSPTLTNCTFTNNKATKYGGGMYNFESSPTLGTVTFTKNTADSGGGIYNSYSSPSLTRVDFTENMANSGGGMYNLYSSPTLGTVTFTKNTADSGGGIYNWQSSPKLTTVTFDSNTANKNGGGIYNMLYSSPILTNVTFTENTANSGGGMYNSNSSPTLDNVTFTKNTADSGGGMYNEDSSPILTTVIFDSNTANKNGGGIYNSNSSPTLTNCTFTNNTARLIGGAVYSTSDSNPKFDAKTTKSFIKTDSTNPDGKNNGSFKERY